MVANDSSSFMTLTDPISNAENVNPNPVELESKPGLTKLQQRLLLLKKPLNLTQAPEIELKPTEAKNENEILIEEEPKIDAATEWLMKTAGLKTLSTNKSPKLPATSPKTMSNYRKHKKELQARIRQKTREEQALRYQVFNADNEILDENGDDYDEEDELFDQKIDNVDNKPKKKLIINEDDEGVEYVDEEEDVVDDEEETDDEVQRLPKNDFVDGEASEDEQDLSEAEEASERDYEMVIEEEPKTQQMNKSRVIIFDSDDENSDSDLFKIPKNASDIINHSQISHENESSVNESLDSKNPEDYLSVVIPEFPSQMVEPELKTIQPENEIVSQQSMVIGSQIDTDELMNLCSGNFGSLKTHDSEENLINPHDFMSQTSFGTPDPILPYGTVKINNSCDDTLAFIDKLHRQFDEADDTVQSIDSDLDSDVEENIVSRKRKRIVNYSDDEEDTPLPKKVNIIKPSLFDSDDEDEEIENINDISMKSIEDEKENKSLPASLLDDEFFTTDDDAAVAERPSSRKWINDDDEDDGRDNDLDEDIDANKGIKNFFDEEAELSGDDVGPDDNESDEGENEYEKDDCDDEEYDQDELRAELAQQYNKQVQNEEYRRLLKLQELFIGDDLPASNMDRSFRRTMRNDISDEDWRKLVEMNPVLANLKFDEEDDEEEDEECLKKSIEMQKWRMSQAKKEEEIGSDIDIMADFSDSPLLSIGRQMLQKTTTQVTKTIKSGQTSFLSKKSNLAMVLKENKTTDMKKYVLFTSQR